MIKPEIFQDREFAAPSEQDLGLVCPLAALGAHSALNGNIAGFGQPWFSDAVVIIALG
jgi:hypothetical protein